MAQINVSPQVSHILGEAYQHYPAAERLTYMDVAARGLLSREVRAAIDAHLDTRTFYGVNKDAYFELVERTRGRFAHLINAQPDEVALTKNVSEGLNMVAAGLPWQVGDNVIVCPALEHPNNVYCWLNLRRRGVEVRMVHSHDGHLPIDEMVHCIDNRTRVVTASTVTFAPGFRTDIDRLSGACRERGVFFRVFGDEVVCHITLVDLSRVCHAGLYSSCSTRPLRRMHPASRSMSKLTVTQCPLCRLRESFN